ncbi:MAG: hypothetical protein ACI8XQ_000967 [Bermanella sp.]|jgi:hypothetical protein
MISAKVTLTRPIVLRTNRKTIATLPTRLAS